MVYEQYTDKEKRKQYNRQYQKEYMRKWRKNNPLLQREIDRRSRERLKDNVFKYLGGPKCIRCNCTKKEVLEINHKNLGGRGELREKNYFPLLRDILKGRKEEFEVLCKVCNMAHYCEKKYNVRYDITLLH